MGSGREIEETLPDSLVHLRLGKTGEPCPQIRGAELPRELPHLPGKLELALGRHLPEAVGLEPANHWVHIIHDRNLDPRGSG